MRDPGRVDARDPEGLAAAWPVLWPPLVGNEPFERDHRHDRRTHQHSLGLAQQREAIDRLEVGKQSLTALLYTGHTLSSSGDRKGPTLKDLAPTFGGQRRDIQRVLHTIEQAQQQLAMGAPLPGVAKQLEGTVGKGGVERLLPRNLFGDLVDESLVARSELGDPRPRTQPAVRTTTARAGATTSSEVPAGTATLFKGQPWTGGSARASAPQLTSGLDTLEARPLSAESKQRRRDSEKRSKLAKEKFAGAIGHGVNPDTAAAIQALLTLTPEELRDLVEDPDMRQVFGRMEWLASSADVKRIRAMAHSTSSQEMIAHALLWAFQGGRTGMGYDDKLFKSIVDPLSDADRLAVDRHFKKLCGVSVEQMIDREASISLQNNRMMKAYWKSQGAAIGEELYQAADGGWLRSISDLGNRHPLLTAGVRGLAPLGALLPLADTVAGAGTNQEAYVAQLDKLRDLTEVTPDMPADEQARRKQQREVVVGQIEQQLSSQHGGQSLAQLNAQESGEQANQMWMKRRADGRRDDAFARMLEAARGGDWAAYSGYKAAYGAETTLGNRAWTHQELERRRSRGDVASLTRFLGERSAAGTFDGYVEEQGGSRTDRASMKTLGTEVAPEGSRAWIDEQAQRLLQAQFGGRTGWGDDRATIERIIAELPNEHRDALLARYSQLAREQGLSDNPLATQERALGPLRYLTPLHWLGNWSSGNLGEDLQLSYGADVHDATHGIAGKGRAYTQVEYDLRHGKPRTPEEQMRRARHLRTFDTGSGLLGTTGMGVSGKIADDRHAELEEAYGLLERQRAHTGAVDAARQPEASDALAQFSDARELSDSAAASASAVQRGLVDGVMTVYTGTATIVTTTALTVVTGGAATPALVAAIAAASAGLSAMGIKRVVLGGKYGGNDAKLDVASAVIDAICAGLLEGQALKTYAERMGSKVPASIARDILHEALKSGAQASGELTRSLLDESLYQGSPEEVLARLRARVGQLARGAAVAPALKAAHLESPVLQAELQAGVQIDPGAPIAGQVLGVAQQAVQAGGAAKAAKLGKQVTEPRPAHTAATAAHEVVPPPVVDAAPTGTVVEPTSRRKVGEPSQHVNPAEPSSPASAGAGKDEHTPALRGRSEPISPHRARDMAEFRQVYGEKVTAYRGIRLAPGEPVIGTYASGNDEGQMVIPNNIRAAAHYAVNPQYTSKAEVARRSEIVIVKFEITANEVGRPAGGWEHIILRPDVDITMLPGYAVVLRQPVAGFDQYAVADPDLIEQR